MEKRDVIKSYFCTYAHHLGSKQGIIGRITRSPYNPPLAAPPAYPVIVAGATTAEREQARAEHAIESTNWQTANHGRRIAVNIGAAAFEA